MSSFESAVSGHVPDGQVPAATLALQAMRFGRLVERQLQGLLRSSGLDRSEFSVLATLLLAPPEQGLTPSELARIVVQTTSGMTKTVNRLTARHLVVRAGDAADARSVLISLTEQGRSTASALLSELVGGFDAALEDTTPGDRAALSAALGAVLPSLEHAAGMPPL